jgi:uncharacterized protein YdhG (YjbR/CyaY superfamily)
MTKANCTSVEDYIDSQPQSVRSTLEIVRATIRKAAPKAEETISYQMPTYSLNGNRLLHFAVWKQHYSIYAATETVVAAFHDDLATYQIEKGTIRFPLSQPVPVKLLGRIVKFRSKEVAHRVPTRADRNNKRSTP